LTVAKTKFNGDYCGEIVLIGFTGNAELIQEYLKKTFGIAQQSRNQTWCKKSKFNLEVAPHVIAHIETYPWETRVGLTLDEAIP